MDVSYSRILVYLDGTARASAALDEALKIAEASRAMIVAVAIVDQEPQRFARKVREMAGARTTALLAEARARCAARGVIGIARPLAAFGEDLAAVLARAATRHRADLVVLGTDGLGCIQRLLTGNVAQSVGRRAPCPVLAVRVA